MNIIMLGPPGSGKGTQAEKLSLDLGIPHISTGSILRHAIENKTELGEKAKKYVETGELVPDELVDKMIGERLSFRDCNDGFILDGFPRDLAQAKALEDMRGIEYVFDINLDEKTIIERLSQRRECPNCRKTYHLQYKKPVEDGVCDKCDTKIIQRDDDNPKTIKNRIQVYEKKTIPLREYYNNENTLIPIDGDQSIEDIYSQIKEHLDMP